jgi:aminoglycoside phosphotransferase (APT) family kinase protein
MPAAFPAERAVAVAARLGLRDVREVREAWSGATSTVLRWGDDLSVKVPQDDPAAVEACLRHATVCRAVAALGVECPPVLLVAEPDRWSHLPVIVSRLLPGRSLHPGEVDPSVWREVGARLARLHAATPEQVPRGLRGFTQTPELDPMATIERLTAAGRLSSADAATLRARRDRLADEVLRDERPVFCHGDIHAENVVIDGGRFAGLLDFAGAGWLDAAWDFAAQPAAAVPHAVDGYAAAGGRIDGLRERIEWCRLQLLLDRMERGADGAPHGAP